LLEDEHVSIATLQIAGISFCISSSSFLAPGLMNDAATPRLEQYYGLAENGSRARKAAAIALTSCFLLAAVYCQ